VRSLLLVLTAIRNEKTRSAVKRALEDSGHCVIESSDYPHAHALLSNGLDPDLFLIDTRSGGAEEWPEFRVLLCPLDKLPICLMTAESDAELRKNPSEFGLRKVRSTPVSVLEIRSLVEAVIHIGASLAFANVESLRAGTKAPVPADSSIDRDPIPYFEELGENLFFLAASPKMLEIRRQAELIANADVHVLILGESGTGKEVVAHLIHKHSSRSRNKFLKVNCAALPAELMESELFGHRKGAFTGALSDRPGKFEQANNGTLFLDEIGEMSAPMQAKILHVLQDGRFSRLGGQESIQTDVRVLAATNVQMENALREKSFREDLYYRLAVCTINLPPLRERREEIPFLVREIVRRAPQEIRKGADLEFSCKLMESAMLYHWPGNLRELHNFVIRTIILRDQDASRRELESKMSPMRSGAVWNSETAEPASHPRLRSIVRDVKDRTEAQLIQRALQASGWNRRRAAESLNISYRGLLYKIQQHCLSPGLSRRGA
jgi:two-component system, NtrC family, response regulator AtoC